MLGLCARVLPPFYQDHGPPLSSGVSPQPRNAAQRWLVLTAAVAAVAAGTQMHVTTAAVAAAVAAVTASDHCPCCCHYCCCHGCCCCHSFRYCHCCCCHCPCCRCWCSLRLSLLLLLVNKRMCTHTCTPAHTRRALLLMHIYYITSTACLCLHLRPPRRSLCAARGCTSG